MHITLGCRMQAWNGTGDRAGTKPGSNIYIAGMPMPIRSILMTRV